MKKGADIKKKTIQTDMRISTSFGKILTSMILMFAGVSMMFGIVALPDIIEGSLGDLFANLVIGITLLVIGFSVLLDSPTPKSQKKERMYQKSKHRFIEIFGLE